MRGEEQLTSQPHISSPPQDKMDIPISHNIISGLDKNPELMAVQWNAEPASDFNNINTKTDIPHNLSPPTPPTVKDVLKPSPILSRTIDDPVEDLVRTEFVSPILVNSPFMRSEDECNTTLINTLSTAISAFTQDEMLDDENKTLAGLLREVLGSRR